MYFQYNKNNNNTTTNTTIKNKNNNYQCKYTLFYSFFINIVLPKKNTKHNSRQ